jgi:MFS transporter, DHA1 family, tetracycline resistance protein
VKSPRARSSLAVIFVTVFIDLLGFGIVIPLLPVYSKAYGASAFELGLLFASFSIAQFLAAPYWGRLSDRMGRRRVLLAGLLGTAAAYVAFALAGSMAELFMARAAAGFCGATVPIAQAYIADVTAPAQRAQGMGLVGAAFGIGFTFGPLFGGELAALDHRLPGVVAAGTSLAAAAFGFFFLGEPVRRERRAGMASLRRLIAEAPRLRLLIGAYFLAILAFSAFETMFTPYGMSQFPDVYGLDHGIDRASEAQILAAAPRAGRYLFGIGILSALIQGTLTQRLVRRFGETRLAVAGPLILGASFAVIGGASYLPFGVWQRWAVVLAGCALMPIGFGAQNPSLQGLISKAAGDGEQGAALGLAQSAASLARVLGPPAGGWIFATALGPASPFLGGAGVLIVAALLALRAARTSHDAAGA